MNSIILKKVPKGSILRSHDIGRVVQELETLDEDKTWKVSVEQYKAERSDLQNNYYHGVVLEMIAKAWGVETEEAHEWLCGTRWGWKDKKVPKTPRNPDGIESVPRRTTTTGFDGKRSVLKKMEFEEFVEFARRFASKKLQLYIPDPDKNYRLNRERQEEAA